MLLFLLFNEREREREHGDDDDDDDDDAKKLISFFQG